MDIAWCRTAGILVACGTAAMLALAGCSSSGSGKQASGAAPASPLPAWASKLGPGVTVEAPASVAPGNDSPGAVVSGLIQAFEAKQFVKSCDYQAPSQQQDCKAGAATADTGSGAPSVKNGAVGYVAIDGSEALVGMTGTFCAGGQAGCFTNTDPAKLFSTTPSFAALWKNATGSSASAYSLTPCEKINGKWYISS